MSKKICLSTLVKDQAGVLVRIALIFSRIGCNINSLIVSPALEREGFSHMTISVVGEETAIEQLIKNMNRLVDVVEAKVLEDKDSIKKELSLVRVRIPREAQAEQLLLKDTFGSRVVDINDDVSIFMTTGGEDKLNALEKHLKRYEVLEVMRTGTMVMERTQS